MLNAQPYRHGRGKVSGGPGAWMPEDERLNLGEPAEVLRRRYGYE